jgi:hypothetical protein
MNGTTLCSAPSLTLSGSNLTVVNFCSPHQFDFDNGDALPPCSTERVKALSLGSADKISEKVLPSGKMISLVSKVFILTDAILSELKALEDDVQVDVVLVPFPLLQALQQGGHGLFYSKPATVSVDRLSKMASSTHFCV